MRRLYPDSRDPVDAAGEYAVPAGSDWLRVNMVATVDGAATDAGGRSAGISDPADRHLFSVLRSLADAVVVGARTAQTERYRRTARPVVLLTRTLALDLSAPVLTEPPGEETAPVLVVAPGSAAEQRVDEVRAHAATVGSIELVLVPGEELDLAAAIDALRQRGLHHLLCEGGPALLASLVEAGLVDELCLTTSPLMGGGGGRIVRAVEPSPPQRWRLAGLCEEDGSLFARWQPDQHTGAD